MRARFASIVIGMAVIAWSAIAGAGDLKDDVKVEILTDAHSGMAPGTYVCAAGHLHVKGTVHNLASTPVGQVKVAGKAFDASGKLLGTATASTKQAALNPDDKATVDLEFLTVTGDTVKRVKDQRLEVVAVAPKP